MRTAFALLAFALTGAPAVAQEAPSETPRLISAPRWMPTEGCDDLRFYPKAAQAQGLEGVVSLDCLVADDGRLSCTVVSEEPEGNGFAEAAVQIAACFRMRPVDATGAPTAGGRYRMRMPFRLQ